MKRNPLAQMSDDRLEKLASDLRMRSDAIDVRLIPDRRVLEIREKPNVINQDIIEMVVEFCHRRGLLFIIFASPVVPTVNFGSVNLTIEIF